MTRPPLVGAHVSSAGRLALAVERATTIGAVAMQLWVDQPQRFPREPLAEDRLAELREALERARLPAYVHVPYLVNLATRDRTHRRRSIDMLARAFHACMLGGLRGAVVHLGSHLGRGYEDVRHRVASGVREACERGGVGDRLVVENAAGAGGQLGADLAELRDLLDLLADQGIRAGLCLDLQHAHAAGADLSTPRGVRQFASALRRAGLARKIVLVHANDSRSASGSRRDLHANPGEGTIGTEGLRACASVAELARVPWVLEVPGPEGKGPTRAEVERLRAIVS